MAHDVFISYASGDKPTADAICASLETHGIRCWVAPRDITPGAAYGDAIISAISRSRVMIVVLSAASNGSPHVLREVERGISKGLVVVPFRIEDVPPSGALEYFLSAPHWLDALTPPLEQHLRQLVRTITLLLESSANAAPHQEGPAQVLPPPQPVRRPVEGIRIVFYNTSSAVTHLLTGTVEIEVDGRYLGRLKRREYLETRLAEGEHRLSLRHRDAKFWEDTRNLVVQGAETYIRVFAKTGSTEFEAVAELPAFFDRKFRRVSSP